MFHNLFLFYCFRSKGKAIYPGTDFMPYTKLLYGNGPGFNSSHENGRENIQDIDTSEDGYVYQVCETTLTYYIILYSSYITFLVVSLLSLFAQPRCVNAEITTMRHVSV